MLRKFMILDRTLIKLLRDLKLVSRIKYCSQVNQTRERHMPPNGNTIFHLRIQVYDALVISAAVWSIFQTKLNSICFTTVSVIYFFSAAFNLIDTVLGKNIWAFWIQVLDETAVILSLPLIATQLSFLGEFAKELAFCNLIPPFVELCVVIKHPEYRMITSDYTAVLQILIIAYIAYSLTSLKMALISFIYSRLYYGSTDNISIPPHTSYGPSISLAMILMGLIDMREGIIQEQE